MLVFYVDPRCIIAFTLNFKKELRHLRKLALSYGLSLLPTHRLEVTEIVIHLLLVLVRKIVSTTILYAC